MGVVIGGCTGGPNGGVPGAGVPCAGPVGVTCGTLPWPPPVGCRSVPGT
jgi:hypothetical protein